MYTCTETVRRSGPGWRSQTTRERPNKMHSQDVGIDRGAYPDQVLRLIVADLDTSHIIQTNKHPSLCTVVVDGSGDHPQPSAEEEGDWRLPSTDPRDEGKFLFRLHTVDLYFWVAEDGYAFAEGARSVLPEHQMMAELPPRQERSTDLQESTMSPVVQKLENVAFQDPAYQATHASRENTATHSAPESTAGDPSAFVPLAYNPAAPPAPEVIKPREDTPPPPDDGQGIGLHAPHSVSAPAYSPPGYTLTQPIEGYGTSSSHIASSPAYSQGPRTSSVSSYTPGLSALSGASTPQTVQGFAGPPSANPSLSPAVLGGDTSNGPLNMRPLSQSHEPANSPAVEILGDSYIQHPLQPLQHLQPQYADYLGSHSNAHSEPLGGFSDYKYDDPEHRQSHQHHHEHRLQTQDDDYAIHNQVYRPTEAEYSSHSKPKNKKENASKLSQETKKVDGGVNRFLKKLEKKIG